MGAFFLIRHDSHSDHSRLAARLESCLSRQEFGKPRRIERPNYSLRLYTKRYVPDEKQVYEDGDTFAFSTGTFIYKENIGTEALRLLLDGFDQGNIDWKEMYGNFCVGVNKGSDLFLFVDRLGIYKVYCDAQRRVYSSSFLAVLESLESSCVNTQAVYEYVFRGATYGNKTVIDEIDQLDCDFVSKISDRVTVLPHQRSLRPRVHNGSIEDHLKTNLRNLRRYFRILAKCFGDNMTAALSGGYDSRLIRALALEQGVTPEAFVYGKNDNADVRIAISIAKSERFPIKHFDKSEFPKGDLETFPAMIKRNFLVFDGCSSPRIFGNGSNLATRADRSAGGPLILNGGGGEVFRIFFPIANVRLTVKQFVRRCYGDFDSSMCTSLFSANRYLAALATKIDSVRARKGSVLERNEIEYLYPRFRARFWMGHENSIDNRFSWSVTPFVDQNIVEDAIAIPLKYKKYGRFEARMIREVSPTLASYVSAHGHDFLHEPALSRKVKDAVTVLRKTCLPMSSYRLKNRLRRLRHTAFPYYLQKDYLRTVIDVEFPYLTKLFHIRNVNDPDAFARICTLECLFQEYQPRLASGMAFCS